MYSHFFRLYLPGFLILSLLVSCGTSNSGAQPSVAEGSPDAITLTQVSATVELSPQSMFGQSYDPTKIAWSSNNSSVAAVDAYGVVSAKALGTAEVTAIIGTAIKTVAVTVTDSGSKISGKVRYEDWAYNASGLTTTNFKAIRYVRINLLDNNGHVLLSSETSNTGDFDFGHVLYPNYQIQVMAWIPDPVAPGFFVKDMGQYTYAVTQAGATDPAQNNIDITQASGPAGAFNILDVMLTGAQFAKQVLGVQPSDLVAYWEKNKSVGTQYCNGADPQYCPNGKGIYVLNGEDLGGGALDTDEFDDDVLMHEFGHYIVKTFAIDDSPGGCHNLTSNDIDLRLAWSEGLGTFFPIAIKTWLVDSNNQALMSMEASADTTLYLDTMLDNGSHPASLSFDVAKLSPATEGLPADVYSYASSEVAVLKILWGLHQTVGVGMPSIWNVIQNYLPSVQASSVPVNERLPTRLDVFWDGLLANDSNSSDLAAFQSIFNERSVYYQDDGAEPNNTLGSAKQITVGAPPKQYFLYRQPDPLPDGSLDVDYFWTNLNAGTSYQIDTENLRNGIDTQLFLLDSNGNQVADDTPQDENYMRQDESCGGEQRVFLDGNSFNSKIVFTPPSNGKYYIEVKYRNKFSYDQDFTGRYGSYDLRVVTPPSL